MYLSIEVEDILILIHYCNYTESLYMTVKLTQLHNIRVLVSMVA